MRCYGALLLLIGLGLLAGCPRPINEEGKKPQPAAASNNGELNTATSELDAGGQPDSGLNEESDSANEDSEAAAEENPENNAGSAETSETGEEAELEPAPEEPPAETTSEVTFPDRRRGTAKADGPAGGSGDSEDDVLDPAAMLGDAADQPAKKPEPPTPLDSAARAFSGDWTVIAVNQDGRSRLAETDDDWLFALANDGSCTVSRHLDGNTSEQSGRWELKDGELTLRLGPARRSYSVEQPRDSVALFTDATSGAVLFCVRLTPGEKAPMLRQSYELGDSELRFRSAGPGGYWRGTLTEPECSLLVHPVGNFVAGTWETPQDEGYVLLELSQDGFDGWWWYGESTAFDGVWISGAE